MKITVLCEDCAAYNSLGILAEHGISLLINLPHLRLLFDVGQSSVFKKNSETIGVSLDPVSIVVLSHAHFDHTGGLPCLIGSIKKKVRLIAHPDAFERKIDDGGRDVGSPISLEQAQKNFDVLCQRESCKITKGVYFLTGIQRKYEDPGTVIFHIRNGRIEPDPVIDDSSIVIRTERGLFVLCGCAHAGIMNIVHEAEEFIGDEVHGLAGGLHLLDAPQRRIRSVIDDLKRLGVEKIYPCHCTGIRATYLMQKNLGARKMSSGERIEV